jgi:hypothetical protein
MADVGRGCVETLSGPSGAESTALAGAGRSAGCRSHMNPTATGSMNSDGCRTATTVEIGMVMVCATVSTRAHDFCCCSDNSIHKLQKTAAPTYAGAALSGANAWWAQSVPVPVPVLVPG